MQAFVFVECVVGQDSTVMGHLQRLHGVTKTYLVGGIYDLVVKVEAPDKDMLRAILDEIKRAPGVASTLTSIVQHSFAVS